MDTSYYKHGYPMLETSDEHRHAVLLTILTEQSLAVVLIIVYFCMVAF